MKHLKTVAVALALLFASSLWAQSARQIIKRVDQNEQFKTEKFLIEMQIKKGERVLIKKMRGYSQSQGDKSYIEFINPEDRGVKYLKIEDELWIYFPDADDIMKISGHMLRQGMMGSDISYEDMMREESLEETYDYELKGSEKVEGRECFVVELKAKVKDAKYARQVVYVDKSRYIMMKIELYAKGDRLIKTIENFDFVKISGRYLPSRTVVVDKRRKDTSTTIKIKAVKFDIKVPAKVFTHRNLKK